MTAWLLDTGPLVAFFDRSDAGHEWAKEQWAQAPVPMLTCGAVLAEAAYLLREHARLPSEKILALFERKVITVVTFDTRQAALAKQAGLMVKPESPLG